VHRLNLILDGKCVVLDKVDVRNEDSSWCILHHLLTLVILPICDKLCVTNLSILGFKYIMNSPGVVSLKASLMHFFGHLESS
jgi:hypothetical protein